MHTSTKVFDGYSSCFRQWRANHSHCRFLHGYSLSFKVWFEGQLDCRGWVQDFGSFKHNGIKESLEYWFDHTVAVAQDDPDLQLFKFLNKDKIGQLRILPNVGAERFAEFVFALIDIAIFKESKGRVRVIRVECFEHSKNSAIFEGIPSVMFKRCNECQIWKQPNFDFYPSRSQCKTCCQKQYATDDVQREKALMRAKERYSLKKEEVFAIGAKWREENIERSRSLARSSCKDQYESSIGKLKHNTRSIIHNSLVKQGGLKYGRTRTLLGCSFETLKLHLESQFQPGMSWENYGQWHVDHKRPCASFDLTKPEEQFKCFHYSNLQPLWAKDNLSKNSVHEGVKYFHEKIDI